MVDATAEARLRTRVFDVLTEQFPYALFVTELAARVGAPVAPDLDRVLGDDAILVVAHSVPDPHLDGDLRVAALAVAPAIDPASNAEVVWENWMRDVLAGHRCC